MEFNELELLESTYLVRESDNNIEAHLCSADNWQFLYPEVERDCIVVYTEASGSSSNNHLESDSVTISIDHDPVTRFITPCSSSLVSSEDIGFTSAFAMDSPRKQKMERDEEDYDPSRIPSSVFERSESGEQAEWSATSNESLFSLSGGISFGRDQGVILGSESDRVEELTKLDEPASKSASVSDEADDDDDTEAVVGEKVLAKAHFSEEELAKLPASGMRSSVSCRSDASDGSTFSFAFPILAPGRAQTPQTSATKGGAFSPNTSHSNLPHSEHENDMETPPLPPPSSTKKSRCCFSCFSICTLPSFCSCSFSCRPRCSFSCCPRCSCCWPFKS